MTGSSASQPIAKIDVATVSKASLKESDNPEADVPAVETISGAIKLCKKSFIAVGLFSAAVNVLMLTPPMYMLSAYDRVLASGSIPTLGMLTLIMVFLLAAMGGFEWVRSQILIRVSNRFDQILSNRLYDISLKQALYSGGSNTQAAPLRDLNGVRQFVTGNGLFAFFDAPWLPIYIFVLFLFHPVFGYIACGAAVYLALLAFLNERASSGLLASANQKANQVNAENSKYLRNAEVVHSMGMGDAVRARWRSGQDDMLLDQTQASARSAGYTALSKSSRIMIQSLILGAGAYLAVLGQISPGMMIAGSILLGRALAPMDQMIGVWKQFVTARGQWERLTEILSKVPPDSEKMQLPVPKGQLAADRMTVSAPGSKSHILKNISFQVPAGVSVGVIGPSGSGKSTLVRAILGIWPLAGGSMRLDGADVFSWDRQQLGPHIGYLPQDIELFEGTVAENIARFGVIEPDQVVAAAQAAGVHELILSLPNGYDTSLAKHKLSGGQRQRVGLARALYGEPVLVVLDEPNSNLDDAGEQALFRAIRGLKARGATVIVVSHRTNIIGELDALLLMAEGTVKAFGARDQVLAEIAKTQQQAAQKKAPAKPQATTPAADAGVGATKSAQNPTPSNGSKKEGAPQADQKTGGANQSGKSKTVSQDTVERAEIEKGEDGNE